VLAGVRCLADEGVAVSLAVAGDGPQRGRVARAVEEMPHVFRYAGYLAGDALDALLDACDVGLVPMVASSWVAVPNKLADYAAAGLAVINGLTGEAQALLECYQAGIAYRPGDVQSFMAAVRRYTDDAELLARHRRGARLLAEERFDARRIYREMADWLVKGQEPQPREGCRVAEP
jgi:glycosyltransferase involved in cell wall biosynthesis